MICLILSISRFMSSYYGDVVVLKGVSFFSQSFQVSWFGARVASDRILVSWSADETRLKEMSVWEDQGWMMSF
jgi:hypothetical protein